MGKGAQPGLPRALDIDNPEHRYVLIRSAWQFEAVNPDTISRVNRAVLQGRQPHRDVIKALIPLPDQGKFLSCSRDGTVCFWNPATMKLQRRIHTVENEDMFRQGVGTMGADFLTSALYMSHSNRLAVASVRNSVAFYNIHGNEKVCGVATCTNHNTPSACDIHRASSDAFHPWSCAKQRRCASDITTTHPMTRNALLSATTVAVLPCTASAPVGTSATACCPAIRPFKGAPCYARSRVRNR